MPHALVPSDHVEAASVFGRNGEKIGTIERLMIEMPWSSLRYDPARKAYETDVTLEELRGGPSELDGEEFDWGDRSPAYRHPQYWTV